ncbi:hypothetical protein [Ferruginibacter sp.]
MMTAFDISIMAYGYFFGGILVHLIEHGMIRKYQLIGCGIALIIVSCYALFSKPGKFTNLHYGFLTLPIIAVLVFNLAGMLSWKITGRELRATWRGARYFYTEKKNWSDHLLSFLIVMIDFAWPIAIAMLLK